MADHGESDKRRIERQWDILLLLEKLGIVPKQREHRDNVLVECCFHPGDETGSLSICVNPQNSRFGCIHCFGCQKRGFFWDVLTARLGGNFQEVKTWTAQACGIVLTGDRELLDHLSQAERIQRTRKWFVKWAQEQLRQDAEAQLYLIERGVRADSFARFQLGLVPAQVRLPTGHGAPSFEDLIAAGIMGLNPETKRPYHVFRNRILIPVLAGREIVHLTGRTLSPEPSKWLDAAETVPNPARERYRKYMNPPGSKTIFGLNTITPETRIVFVGEGPFDALLSAQEGVPALALLGTSLMQEIDLLAGLLPHHVGICLGLDADPAGRRQMAEGATKLMERGFPVSVILEYDGAKDAAEFIQASLREEREGAWRARVLAAKLFACYMVERVPPEEIVHPMTAPRAFAGVLSLLKRSDPLHRSLAMQAMADCLHARDPRCPITAAKLEYYMSYV